MDTLKDRLALRTPRPPLAQGQALEAAAPDITELNVGKQLRRLRRERSLSLRSLAERSGLNANTLSLIERSKTSPSVSTLQQLAVALQVPIISFFDAQPPKKAIVYQKNGHAERMVIAFGGAEVLGAGLTLGGAQPLRLTLLPGAGSGLVPVVHTGHEFVYCLEGELTYSVEGQRFVLEPGDVLIFEAHLPHCWVNESAQICRWLLLMCPADENEHPPERHFQRRPEHKPG